MSKKKRRLFPLVILGVLLIIGVFIKPYYDFIAELTGVSPIKIFFFNGDFKKNDNRINILLLGKGGIMHDGPNLTDSISVATFDMTRRKLSFISIPRDIWSATLSDKINSAYAYGEAKKKGSGGMILAKSEVGAVIGQPIHYTVVIDFDKFKELIDYVGGIDITIEQGFDDYKFPIPGKENDICNNDEEYKCRYQHISFKKGNEHMDGERALAFVRSRNAPGSEGTDFARNKRQQKVITALMNKILNQAKTLDIRVLRELYTKINTVVERDMTNAHAAYIGKKFLLTRGIVISHGTLFEDLFIVPPRGQYEGKYVLVPASGSFESIHNFVECVIVRSTPDQCLDSPKKRWPSSI